MFKKLTKIKLSRVKDDDFHLALEKLPGLISIELVNARGSIDLNAIAVGCKRLETLQIYYSKSVHVSSGRELDFPKLRKLTIYDTESRYCCKPLLRSCPEIEDVTLCDCTDLNDTEFFDILAMNPMENCKSLVLLAAPLLTAQTARGVMTCVDKYDKWK